VPCQFYEESGADDYLRAVFSFYRGNRQHPDAGSFPERIRQRVYQNHGRNAGQLSGQRRLFKSIYVWSGIWQGTGYSSIIYLAALAGINPELEEVAYIDGANIWQRIWHVDVPGILPTAIILFIVNAAGILNVGFEKVYLMQNPLNMSTSDVIATYTYRMGLVDMNYSLATAVGLFQSVISFIFMLAVNQAAKKISQISLW
jgi:putative aldouronate transport system permease protein